MTGMNLAPDTAREVSTLKRRVTALERTLDRVRRSTAPSALPVSLAPFASFEGTGYGTDLYTGAGIWNYYAPANTIETTVTDPTHHLTIAEPWVLRVDIAGVYEFGLSVIFDSPTADHHYIGIRQIDDAYYNIASVPAPTTIVATLSGSRVRYAPAGSHWTPLYGDDGNVVTDHGCRSFWARALSLGDPVEYVGSE